MKIDTTKIEGYEKMSAEEKLSALEGYEIDIPSDHGAELQRLKDALSKSNSEAAEYKRQLRAKQTDEEARAADAAKAQEAMQQELEALRKDKDIGIYKAKFLELGYDANAAQQAAQALQSGDFETMFATQAEFIDMTRKAAASGALNQQPKLTAGEPVGKEAQERADIATLRRFMGLPAEKGR